MSSPIVITTPTGNIGSKVVAELLRREQNIHVIARHPEKLPQTVQDRATVHVGDLLDESFVSQVTENAAALFWLTPPMWSIPVVRPAYQHTAHVVRSVVQRNKIPYIVHLSSAGAQDDGRGPISLLRTVEEALNGTDANVVHLRPGFFFENFAGQSDAIQNAGAVFMPLPPHCRLPMVATVDIAAIAANLLVARNTSGKTYRGIHGPTDLTLDEAVRIIGDGIGREVRYVLTTLEQTQETLLSMGASTDFARLYREMFQSWITKEQYAAEPRTVETTTPTTLRVWAEQALKPLIEQ